VKNIFPSKNNRGAHETLQFCGILLGKR